MPIRHFTVTGIATFAFIAAMQEPAVPVRPFHHRRNTKSEPADIAGFSFNLSRLRPLYAVLIHSCLLRFTLIFLSPVQPCCTVEAMLYHNLPRGRNGNDHPTQAKEWVHRIPCAGAHQAQGRNRSSRVSDV